MENLRKRHLLWDAARKKLLSLKRLFVLNKLYLLKGFFHKQPFFITVKLIVAFFHFSFKNKSNYSPFDFGVSTDAGKEKKTFTETNCINE